MAIGRVTQRMLVGGSLDNLQQGLGRLAKIQEQLSTGRQINRPSDNPTGTTTAMRLRTALASQEQYARNAEDGIGWLTQIDATLTTVTDRVNRAKDLAIAGANASVGPVAREALAVEVEGIKADLLAQSNTTYLDRPVFGGVTSGRTAYDASGTWIGTAGDVKRRIADGVTVKVDLDGRDVFGTGPGSVFAELDALATALRSGNVTDMQTSIGDLKSRSDVVTSARTAAGTRYQRIDNAGVAAGDAQMSLKNNLSTVENADLAAVTVDLKMQEVAYQASLAATSRVLQPSLIDFLR